MTFLSQDKYHHVYSDGKYKHVERCETQTQLWQPGIDLELGSVDLMTVHTRYLRNPYQILLVKFALGGDAVYPYFFSANITPISILFEFELDLSPELFNYEIQ